MTTEMRRSCTLIFTSILFGSSALLQATEEVAPKADTAVPVPESSVAILLGGLLWFLLLRKRS